MSRVQPQGGIKFKSHYVQGGDGVSACLHVTGFPTKGLANMWMKPLVQQGNAIGFHSTESLDSKEFEKQVKTTINEKGTRLSPNANDTDNNREAQEIMDLHQVLEDVSRKNEAMKGISIRLWIYDLTEERLASRVKDIRDSLSQFKAEVMLDEQDLELDAIFTRPDKQSELIGERKNTPIRSYDLAGGYYLDHEKREDENGSYFGKTSTDGAVVWDFFKRDASNPNSFLFVAGNPSMGQGTFAMAVIDNAFSDGHYIRNINTDTRQTLLNYTRNMDGLVLEMSGGKNMINPFQVFPSSSDRSGQVDEIKSFRLHLSKLRNFYEALAPGATDTDIRVFRSLVRSFYCQYPSENDPLWYIHPKRHLDRLKATRIPYEEYPKLSHFVAYLEGELIKARDVVVKTAIHGIKETFDELLQTQPDLFEGTTNPEFRTLSEERLVTFDLSGLVGQPEYLNAQLFSVLALISYDVSENGKRQRERLRQNPRLQEADIDQFIVNITNVSQLLNPRYPSASELTNELIDALSQNYAGMIVQAPNLQAMLGKNSTGGKAERHFAAMNVMFDRMNYRAFAQLGATDKLLLEEILKSELGEHELNAITNFEQRQLYLSIRGSKGLIFTQEYDEDDLNEYGGWF